MKHEIKFYTVPLDLSSEENKQNSAKELILFAKTAILNIISEIQKETFDYSPYCFNKTRESNLTNKSGLYLIVNENVKKIYLGSTLNLAQRKGEYNQNFSNPNRIAKVNSSMRNDLTVSNSTVFYFVPLIAIPSSDSREIRQQLSIFFDLQVEKPLLEDFIDKNSTVKNVFYNQKTVGSFQPNNTFGGTPQSGIPSKPTRCGNFAWESLSACAISMKVDRKTIRNKIKKGLFEEIENVLFSFGNF